MVFLYTLFCPLFLYQDNATITIWFTCRMLVLYFYLILPWFPHFPSSSILRFFVVLIHFIHLVLLFSFSTPTLLANLLLLFPYQHELHSFSFHFCISSFISNPTFCVSFQYLARSFFIPLPPTRYLSTHTHTSFLVFCRFF